MNPERRSYTGSENLDAMLDDVYAGRLDHVHIPCINPASALQMMISLSDFSVEIEASGLVVRQKPKGVTRQ